MFTERLALRRRSRLTRLVIILSVLALGANLVYTASSKSISRHKAAQTETASRAVGGKQARLPKLSEALSPLKTALPALMPQANPTPTPEAIATYASDCTTPKTSFVLNEVVCAKATGIDLQTFPRSVTWNNTGGLVVSRTDLTGNTISFQIPNDATYAIDNQTGDNRGIWQVKLVPVGRSVVRANAFFTVSDPTSKAADLVVYNVVNDPIGDVPDGANITVSLTTTNNGPDAVPDVQLTELVPSNATFVSASQDSGPTFNCAPPAAGASVCTISSFASGAQATFTFIYNVNSGVPKGTVIASTAAIGQITSPTSVVSELNSRDNQWTARAATSVNTNTPTGCVLACPENMIVTATSQSGAVVNYGSAEPSGTCGTISGDASHPSGSTFPVGTTTVNLTSSQGGGGCSFTVTVVEVAAPTITCQADQTAQATGSQLEVPVSLNTPSTSGNGVILDHSSRSDNRPLTDPYPVGTTIITWVATETFQGTDPQTNDPIVIEGRAVSCTQKIIVTSTGAPTISCPTDRTFNAASCDTVLTAAQIGTPTYSGSNATLTSRRSDDLALTDPFPGGQTRITWTVTDDVDRVASCVQTITITSTGGGDTTPPTLDVPPDVTVTTGGCSALLDDELGVATADDNCSSSVSITRTGIPLNQLGQPTFVFPVGVTTITYTATDGAGNSTVKTQKITVKELTPPTISAPADVVLYTGAGATSCGLNIANLDASLGTATTSDNCPGTVTVARSNVPAGNNFPVGDTIVTYTATDISGNTASANQKVTVRDNTVPTISAPADVTLYTGSGATTCDVTVSNLDATLGTATANDNCPGVTVARGGGNVFPLGDTNVIYTATDAYGNTATATQKVTVVDNTPPVVTPPANITVHLPLNSTATSMVVNYPNPATATDNCAGTITFNYNPASGSTFSVGTTTVTVTATDAHNNNAQTTFTVTVLYNFTGFFSPVINPPTFNVVNAGRAIPVKFSLSGNKGLNIFAANSPQSGVIPCDASAPATNLTDTVTAGSSSLSYDASTDQYIYVWKTDSSWAGTCRQLVVTLNDGSVHVANFKFR